jgi:hypothetical protein
MSPLVGASLTNVLVSAQVLAIKEVRPNYGLPPIYIFLDNIQQNDIIVTCQTLCL